MEYLAQGRIQVPTSGSLREDACTRVRREYVQRSRSLHYISRYMDLGYLSIKSDWNINIRGYLLRKPYLVASTAEHSHILTRLGI